MESEKVIASAKEAAEMARRFAPGTFGCHEAMHMASVLAEMVEERLCGHSAIMLNHRWKRKARAAADHLFALYQEIGAAHLSAPPEAGDGR